MFQNMVTPVQGGGGNIYMNVIPLGVSGQSYATITIGFKAKNIQVLAASTSSGCPISSSPSKVFAYWDETNGCTGWQSDGTSLNTIITDVDDTGFKFSPHWSNFTATSQVFVLAAD